MARFSPLVLQAYLFGGRISGVGCLRRVSGRQGVQSLCCQRSRLRQRSMGTQASSGIEHTSNDPTIPFRKQLKDEAKKRRADGTGKKAKSKEADGARDGWELTVGIEIHAQLNTARKLFSSAASTIHDAPNTHVALFDVAMPGSQPTFQKETLIPALRAALALNCDIQRTSRFDRKHYFHWDQPSGYQITQYYEPFAKDGHITLYPHDGIASQDGGEISIGIKQIQMEQDTAKTISLPGDEHLLDFNRVGLPLIEIITLPQIHHPSTAAALVRKIQIILQAVDACVLGMESGGLRADVNVSVRRKDSHEDGNEYGGVKGLGTRTEIKNLSSVKAVKDAIIAERDRQIQVLEAGGVIEGETRGWTIGSLETKRLRGKEGEVDYRYMPDPDLGPVVIGDDLVTHLRETLSVLPDQVISTLTEIYGLTVKDAMSLMGLNDGGAVEYFYNVICQLESLTQLSDPEEKLNLGRLCGNWVLHEMGGLIHDQADETNPLKITVEGDCIIPAEKLAQLLHFLHDGRITGKTAKKVLAILFEQGLNATPNSSNVVNASTPSVKEIIDVAGLWFSPLPDHEYEELAKSVLDMKVVEGILGGKKGKLNFLLGQMMRKDNEGRIDPQKATEVLRRLVEEHRIEKA